MGDPDRAGDGQERWEKPCPCGCAGKPELHRGAELERCDSDERATGSFGLWVEMDVGAATAAAEHLGAFEARAAEVAEAFDRGEDVLEEGEQSPIPLARAGWQIRQALLTQKDSGDG